MPSKNQIYKDNPPTNINTVVVFGDIVEAQFTKLKC